MNLRSFWQAFNKPKISDATSLKSPVMSPGHRVVNQGVEFAPNDPIIAYFQSSPGVVEIDKLEMDSPALRELKAAGVKLAVPLVSQGELIGLLNLGPRLSEQEYSADDHGLLNNLATQAAPALRVAQLVRQQQIETQARERIEHELRVARLIQQTLLPKELPQLPGWNVAVYYQPARAVGGDFYDFINLPGGRLGLIVGDVTDKGVPAALMMATTRSILRGAIQQFSSPGEVLERANNLLIPDIPEKMFVTCLYAILEPETGHLLYANAGHDLPYHRSPEGAKELRATGMPLGLMPEMRYEQKEVVLLPGESILFYSDGLVEAHNPHGDMFGFPYLQKMVANYPGGEALIEVLLEELKEFTGPGWEQEDDVTFVTLERKDGNVKDPVTPIQATQSSPTGNGDESTRTLAEFSLPSAPGNERQAMEQVGQALHEIPLSPARLERIKTAVAEATMNAMEHGNKYQPDLPVIIRVLASDKKVTIRITDHGKGQPIPLPETPDLKAKLAGLQTPRGWGLFLIKNMVDEMNVTVDDVHHTVELVLYIEGA